jgi:Tfp pilus assembly major pilin PilA
MKHERGLSLVGLIIVASLVAVLALVGFKLMPTYIEYFTVQKVIKDLARSPEYRGASVKDIKIAFAKRADIDNISSLKADDLEITKEGSGGFTIVASYAVKIPLFGNVSACIDFEVHS